ncbi:MAG: AAA family ATPase [Selenomonas sp.]|nr:AAA family ATPase [Selenomonas sp.]
MVVRPNALKQYDPLDLRLGIKSSLSDVKATLALVVILWESMNRPARLPYSQQDGEAIVLADYLKDNIFNYLKTGCQENGISREDLFEKINATPLFTAQLEHLQVAFSLIWKIGDAEFSAAGLKGSLERTGQKRFPKTMVYSAYMDVIHAVIYGHTIYNQILLSWLGFEVNKADEFNEYENNLLCVLNVFSENAIYKLDDDDAHIIFNQESIYQKLLETGKKVNISAKEKKGPLRIYSKALQEHMNPYLNYSRSSEVSITENMDKQLGNYSERVGTFLKILTVKKAEGIAQYDISQNDQTVCERKTINWKTILNTSIKKDLPLNKIIFGAPGTGKSHQLLLAQGKLIPDDNAGYFERVTFHPDYTYAQFVGTYKPVTAVYTDESTGKSRNEIEYKFVPGPFMRVYINAIKSAMSGHPKPCLLIIEEINRARVAAVFGDVFQLLDRNPQGISTYGIQASEDIKGYLQEKLGGAMADYDELKLPNNMFIWATMNSADQGVFPMDTAFKRRWDFEYLGVDDNEDKVNCNVELIKDQPDSKVNWNALRKAINKKLSEDCHLNEDKLLGPFFLSGQIIKADNTGNIIEAGKFREAFKNKVIMYLFEDAARQYRQKFFKSEISDRYSHICTAFDTLGMGIFGDDFKEDYYNHFDPQGNS